MIPIHLAAILFVFIGSVYGFEKLFYSGAKLLVPASEEQFKDALKVVLFGGSHQIRNQQSIKSSCIYLLFSFFYLFLLLLCSLPYLGPSFPTMNMNGFEPSMFMVPIGATIVPISVVLLLFQNNPIRWLLAVRKYKQGKYYLGKRRTRNTRENAITITSGW